MIQRIQTLFLSGIIVVGIVLFYLPLFSYSLSDASAVVRHQFYLKESIYLVAMNCIVMVTALISIFMYRNRSSQVKLCSLNMLLVTVLVVLNFFVSGTINDHEVNVKFESGTYMLLVNLIFLWAAIHYIRKDDALVRSADRLR